MIQNLHWVLWFCFDCTKADCERPQRKTFPNGWACLNSSSLTPFGLLAWLLTEPLSVSWILSISFRRRDAIISRSVATVDNRMHNVLPKVYRRRACRIFTQLISMFSLLLSSPFFQSRLLSNPSSSRDSPLDSGSSSHAWWSQGTSLSPSPGRRMAGQSQRASGWPLTTSTSQAP